MKTRFTTLLVGVILTITFAAVALAQGPGGPPPGGGGQGPGQGMAGRMAEIQKQPNFQLMRMVRNIEAINKDLKYTLTSAQAKQVLAVVKPLTKKSKLTQDEAKTALKSLKKIFTAKQLNAMARIKPEQRRPGTGPRMGQGQRPGGGQGRPGGPGGQVRRFDPNAMKTFNPFYINPKAPKNDLRAKEQAKRWNDFFNALEKKAKSK